jgi:hypothetical protein
MRAACSPLAMPDLLPRSSFVNNHLTPQPDSPGFDNLTIPHGQPERFVDADVAADFLSISRKYLLKLSRLRVVPAHPVGIGSRKQWRFRISELEKWALSQNMIVSDNASGSLRAAKKGGK